MGKRKRSVTRDASIAQLPARVRPRRPAAPGMTPRQILVHLKRMLVFLADYVDRMEQDFPADEEDKMTR